MVAIFLFLPPSHYTKNTYLTILNPTTPQSQRDRVDVNICNKPKGTKKPSLTFICVYLRSSAVAKKEDLIQSTIIFYKNLSKNAPFFSPP